MKKKTDDRKENAKFEKFKKDILPKLTYYNVHAMGQDEINISKDMLLADKASSYVLQSKKCAELIINIILKATDGDMKVSAPRNAEDIILESFSTQKAFRNRKGKRSAVFDFFAKVLLQNMYINMEFQRLVKGATLLRQRFYNAMIDIDALEEGDEFTDLPKNCFIFICEKNIFYKNTKKNREANKIRKIYHIISVIAETGDVQDDKVERIYVNLSAPEDDTPLGKLIHDLKSSNPDDMYYSELAEEFRYYRETEEGVRKMYKAWSSYEIELNEKDKALQKKDRVIRKQEQELKEKDAKFVLYLFKHDISINEIANETGLSIPEINKIIQEDDN